jgi:hypothetical protein
MTRRGARLRAFAAAIFDDPTMQYVVDPAVADLQAEPFSVGRYLAVLKLVVLLTASSLFAIGTPAGDIKMAMRCSFCRRRDSEVAKLVAGPRRLLSGRVYICDRCANETIRIMERHSGEHQPSPQTESLRPGEKKGATVTVAPPRDDQSAATIAMPLLHLA